MDKIIYQDSNEALMESVARNGEAMVSLIDSDRGIKSASSDLCNKELLEKYRPTDDKHCAIHLIAMGDSSHFGYNRNGDWFDGDVLQKRAHTFVTHGHMFREHRNKDPKGAIGTVKYAAYHPKMHRVEIIVHMDKDKAPEEFEMAKKGSALNFSMSCKVPNDRCSCCGNEAKTIRDYCEHLGSKMGQYIPEMQKYAFAYNDNPTFFDISRVKNPADRIARHLEYSFSNDEMGKAASCMCKAASAHSNVIIPSAVAAMAEGVNCGAGAGFDLSEQLVLEKLARAEAAVEYMAENMTPANMYKDENAYAMVTQYPFAMMEKFSKAELDTVRATQPGTLFREFAKKACVMSFPAFCQYITGEENPEDTPMFKKAALMLPTIFRDIMSNMLTISPCTSLFRPCGEIVAESDPKRCDLVQNVMDEAEEKFSVRAEPVHRRVVTIIIKAAADNTYGIKRQEAFVKAATAEADIEKAAALANMYGQYQIGALCAMRDMLENQALGDNVYDMIAAGNTVRVFDKAEQPC